MTHHTHGTCLQCQHPLGPGDPRRKFCGAKCRNKYNNELKQAQPVAPDEHGRRVGYLKGCRCEQCRRQLADYSRRYRKENPTPPAPTRERKGILRGPRTGHGTTARYKQRCRCTPCKKAVTQENNEWRLANPDKFAANQDRYRRRNPDKVRGLSQARAAAPYDDDAIAYYEIIKNDPCSYCGEPSGTIDHIRPVARHGKSHWWNLTPACKSCNPSKGTKPLLEFLLYRLI